MKKLYATLAVDGDVEIFYKQDDAMRDALCIIHNGCSNGGEATSFCAVGFRKGTGIKPKLGVVYEIDMEINRVAKVSL